MEKYVYKVNELSIFSLVIILKRPIGIIMAPKIAN